MAEVKHDFMSIGQVARAAGVAATTLRYYEREGVLSPSLRSRAGYRLYDRQAVEQLDFIRSAQAVGFTLGDIRTLLAFDGTHKGTLKKEVQALIETRLGELAQKMSHLRRVQAALAKALQNCQHSEGECPVLKDLHVHNAPQRLGKPIMGPRTDSGLSLLSIIGVVSLLGVGALGYSILRHPRAAERQETLSTATKTVALPVEGMSCGSCVASVKRTVEALPGVSGVKVSLEKRQVRVHYEEGEITPDRIAAAIRDLGYETGEPVAGASW